jgi:hypothetical protein
VEPGTAGNLHHAAGRRIAAGIEIIASELKEQPGGCEGGE